ncbi:hypothetical protein G7046_g9284 [Stylonectria norvegica]|nr:hypothetical protein G7046_g9284 [Stylonectria norvegica]
MLQCARNVWRIRNGPRPATLGLRQTADLIDTTTHATDETGDEQGRASTAKVISTRPRFTAPEMETEKRSRMRSIEAILANQLEPNWILPVTANAAAASRGIAWLVEQMRESDVNVDEPIISNM